MAETVVNRFRSHAGSRVIHGGLSVGGSFPKFAIFARCSVRYSAPGTFLRGISDRVGGFVRRDVQSAFARWGIVSASTNGPVELFIGLTSYLVRRGAFPSMNHRNRECPRGRDQPHLVSPDPGGSTCPRACLLDRIYAKRVRSPHRSPGRVNDQRNPTSTVLSGCHTLCFSDSLNRRFHRSWRYSRELVEAKRVGDAALQRVSRPNYASQKNVQRGSIHD